MARKAAGRKRIKIRRKKAAFPKSATRLRGKRTETIHEPTTEKAPCKGERDTKAKRCILVRYGYTAKGDVAVRTKIKTGLPKSIEELLGKRSDNVAKLAFDKTP